MLCSCHSILNRARVSGLGLSLSPPLFYSNNCECQQGDCCKRHLHCQPRPPQYRHLEGYYNPGPLLHESLKPNENHDQSLIESKYLQKSEYCNQDPSEHPGCQGSGLHRVCQWANADPVLEDRGIFTSILSTYELLMPLGRQALHFEMQYGGCF